MDKTKNKLNAIECKIERFDFDKTKISEGKIIIDVQGQLTTYTYSEPQNGIKESTSSEFHKIKGFIELRKIIEEKYKSILGCKGCQKNTSLRYTGTFAQHYISIGKPATGVFQFFEPTDEIDNICTVQEQEEYNDIWIESMRPPKELDL